jgi:hypothetical protein
VFLPLAAERKEDFSSLKKRSKKLLARCRGTVPNARAHDIKVFWFFFSKKNRFLRRTQGV